MSILVSSSRKTLCSTAGVASSSRSILASNFSIAIPRYAAAAPSPTSKPKASKGGEKVASICPPGTVMKGLSILKDQPDPVAKPDEEYPAWLWTLLDTPSTTESAPMKSDGSIESEDMAFRNEKKKLRLMNRANLKAANYLKTT